MRTPNSERWRAVEQVLDAALDLPAGERAAFLDTTCGDDPELRAEVERLLRAHDQAADFLEVPLPNLTPIALAVRPFESDSRPAMAGLTLGDRYVLERELGRGGMATVYLARDLKHQRPVAVKVLDAAIAHAVGAGRFLREIEITANLQHPHILPLFDSGEAGNHTTGGRLVYYVTPYVAGDSLRERLSREGRLSVDDAVRIARDVAAALDYAHRMGVLHRDIKPANILLHDGQAIVADFGIARALSRAAGGQTLTRAGATPGTPAYMSPEQASGDVELAAPSDLYSLGCVLYEMLAGSPPFSGPRAQLPPPLRAMRPEVPIAIERTIAKALARNPEDRFRTASEFVDELESRTIQRKWSLSAGLRGGVLATLGVILLGVAAVTVTRVAHRAAPAFAAPAAAIAVLPFVPAVPDTALTRIGRELVITLSATLDGVGAIRTVEALTMLANAPATGTPPSLEDARALARRMGASSLVYGSIMRFGERARIDLALYPTSGGDAIARASVTALPDDMNALTDSAAWALIRQVWQRAAPPTPSLAAITTHSIPALRAFLEGERLVVDGQWRAASDAFQRAIANDSTFWLAYWRFAFSRDFNVLPVDPEFRAKYQTHRGDLPERDRLLIEASMTDRLSEHYERLKAINTRFPDYWLGWWTMSEHLAHAGPLLGTSESDLRAALERTIALNPGMISAWNHLFWVALWQRDTLLSAQILRELTALRYDSTSRQETGFDGLRYFRYLDGVARWSGPARELALAKVGLDRFASPRGELDPNVLSLSSTAFGFPRAQVEFMRALLARKVRPAVATAGGLALAVAHAERGAWESALLAMDSVVAANTDPSWPLYRYRLAVIGAWLGAFDAQVATAQRSAVARVSAQLQPASRAELAWLDGVLAVARIDAGALAEAQRALNGTDSISAPFLARSLAAFSSSLAGAKRRAADSLVALEHERAEFGWSRWRSEPHPFLTAVDRLAAARWLNELGDAAGAAQLLTWHQAVLFPLYRTREANVIVEPIAYFERARAAEALGRADLAHTYYKRFLWIYDAPTAAHWHLVSEARGAVARIERRE